MREARRRRKMTIVSVAEALGRDENTTWRWEKGYMRMTADDLHRLASIYGVSVGWLFNDDHNPQGSMSDLEDFVREEWDHLTHAEKAIVLTATEAARQAKQIREACPLCMAGDNKTPEAWSICT